jgi:O-antigen/teichoic acid export membrane protein
LTDPLIASASDRRPAHQAGILAIGQILATLADVATPLFIVRVADKADVGALSAALLVYTTLSMAFSVGLPGTLQFHMPNRPIEERRAIARQAGLLLAALGAGAGALLAAIAAAARLGAVRSDAGLADLWLLAALPIGDLPLRMFPGMLVVERAERAAAGVSIFRSLCLTIGVIVPLAFGMPVQSLMLALSGAGLLFAAVAVALYRRTYANAPAAPSPVSAGGMLRFAFPLGLTELVANLNNRVDRYLIFPFGAVALAEYTAGSWQIPVIPSITLAIGVAYGPALAALFKAGAPEQAVSLWREQTAKTSLLIVPIAMVFVVAAEEAIEVLFTEQYLVAAGVLRIYALMNLGRVTAFGSVLVAAGRPRWVLRSAFIALLANVAISVPMTLALGFQGPAIGAMVAYIPIVCAYCWHIGQAAGVPFRAVFPLRRWLDAVALAVPPAAAALAAKLLLDLPAAAMLGIEALILVSGYVALGVATGRIGRGEWRFLVSVLRLRGGR